MLNPDLMLVYGKILLYILEVVFVQTRMHFDSWQLEQGEVPYMFLVCVEKGEMQTELTYTYQYPTVQSPAMVPH